MSQLHIVHIVYSFRIGGLENGIVNIINNLPATMIRHSIICLADYDQTFFDRITVPDVAIYQLHKKSGQDLGMLWRLWKLLGSLNADVVHTRNIATMECQLTAALRRVPLRIHGEHGWDMVDLAGNNKKYLLLRKWLSPLIHDFVALSLETLDYLKEKLQLPEHKLHHICNGVDTERFYPQLIPASCPIEMAGNDTLWLGTVGRMVKVKNQMLLAEAFILLYQQRPEQAARLRLMLTGNGEELAEIRQRLIVAGVIEQCWLTGERADIPQVMTRLDIFVLPSLAEGISNTLLEAMACGLPIVATLVGGNGDLIVEGQTGYLVPSQDPQPMANALARYIDCPALLKQHGVAARTRALKQYSIDSMVSAYGRLYGLPMDLAQVHRGSDEGAIWYL